MIMKCQHSRDNRDLGKGFTWREWQIVRKRELPRRPQNCVKSKIEKPRDTVILSGQLKKYSTIDNTEDSKSLNVPFLIRLTVRFVLE